MEFEEKRDLSPRRKGTKEEGFGKPLTKGMTLGAGFAKSLRPKPAAALWGGPVWPQAIQRSGVEIIFFLFEHRFACASL
jgi:hypothetical protein